MPITLTSFTPSAPLLSFPSNPRLHTSSPHRSPDFLPLCSLLEPCSGKGSGICRDIYLISIFTFKFRFIEPVWQSPGVAGSRKPPCFSTSAPTILGLCLKCPLSRRMAKWRSAHWEWMALLRIEKRPSV